MSAEKTRTRRTSPANRAGSEPKTKLFDDEVQVALEHQDQLNREYATLVERREQLNAEIERVSKLANQVVGRLDTLQELRGERQPLLPISEIAKRVEKSQQGAPPKAPPKRTPSKRRRGGSK